MSAFDWQFPYASYRAARFSPATSWRPRSRSPRRPACACCQQGGNAVDAALATAIALTVVEPITNGIGSDAFAIVWDGASCTASTPRAARPPRGRRRFFGPKTMPQRGWDSVTVPGCVSAWVTLSERFGKLPFADLFETAIGYARDGYLVSPRSRSSGRSRCRSCRRSPASGAFMPKGRAPLPGENFSLPDQAKTLELIARIARRSLLPRRHRGKNRRACEAARRRHDAADLAAHTCDWVEPLGAGLPRLHRCTRCRPTARASPR